MPLDLSDARVFANPSETFSMWSQLPPMVEVKGGGYAVLGHAATVSVLEADAFTNIPSRFSVLRAANAETSAAADFACRALAFRDGEEHRRVRREIARIISSHKPPSFSDLSEIAIRCLATTVSGEGVDLVQDIAPAYVGAVMCEWFGLPLSDAVQLDAWSRSIFRLFAPIRDRAIVSEIDADVDAFRTYMREAAETGTGFLAALFDAEISADNAVDNAILIYMDGIENVRYGIGSAALIIGQETRLEHVAVASPTEIRAHVQEAFRLLGPASIIARVAEEETTLSIVDEQPRRLAKGTPVFLVLAAANRDPKIFAQPDLFQLDRDFRQVLNFGRGRHGCLGGHAATEVTSAFIRALAVQTWSVQTAVEDAAFVHRFGHVWPESVFVKRR